MFWYFGGGGSGAEKRRRVVRKKEACFILFFNGGFSSHAVSRYLQDSSKLQMIDIPGNRLPGSGAWQAQFF